LIINKRASISLLCGRPSALSAKLGPFIAAIALLAVSNTSVLADLLAHWTFDEAVGTVAHDSAGGGLDGTLSPSGAGFVSGGISSNAVSLSRAANGFVNMGNVLPLTNGNGNGNVFGIGTGGGGYGLWIQQSDNRLTIGKSQVNHITSAAQVSDINWHHVAVTKSGTNVFFYLDGVQYPAPPYDSGGYTFSAPGYIGAWLNPSGLVDNSFYGAIDELAVYSRELTAAEIQAIYNAGSVGKCTSPSPPHIVSQPSDQTVTVGGTATLLSKQKLA
jgi:hypothetical protein